MAVHEVSRSEGCVRHGGSVMGHTVVMRNIMAGHEKLVADYFSSNPVYDDDTFRRRYRMRKYLFLRVMNAVTENDVYFTQQPNAANKLGCSLFKR
ncbi:hypothetical protein BAE44_0003766 [Dichanthelium oligosanthes]|uniref:Uncharacterized protein n=1 Tax=Dichanthelium oligosanthes TaxID=888268 RepID=A0A1E5WCV9_9POAL|nr:hypothetical protein BAE44_0003766 [Dichanthelium oligosanthes]